MTATEPGHRIYRAPAAAGPWSDPVVITAAGGIDLDLCWDEDGLALLTWSDLEFDTYRSSIRQADLDPASGELLGPPRSLWSGTGMSNPEAPHLYHRDGWWYLLIAEGGTERGHSVSVARSRSPRGPFEGHEANPILTHRSTNHPVQNTGHADLVQTPDGEWAMVYLGVRTAGISPGFHVNGRETFLAGIQWQDGWPTVDETRFAVPQPQHDFVDTFAGAELDPRWVSPHVHPDRFARRDGTGLILTGSRRVIATRVRDRSWTVSARLDASAGTGRLIVRLDDGHWCGLEVRGSRVEAVAEVGGKAVDFGGRSETLDPSADRLWITSLPESVGGGHPGTLRGPDVLAIGLGDQELARIDGRYISTEVAGGFTGRVVGVEVVDGLVTVSEIGYEAG